MSELFHYDSAIENNINSDISLSLSKYTFDVWMDSYPNSDFDTFAKLPTNIFDFLHIQRNVLFSTNPDFIFPNKVHIVPLDDAYMNWLHANHFENTQEMRLKYINLPRTNDEYMQLLKAQEWDKDYDVLGIPVVIMNENPSSNQTNFKLSNATRDKLLKYLQDVHGNNDIFVTNCVLKCDDYYNHADEFLNMAKLYFENNPINVTKWYKQKHKKKTTNVYVLVIPYIVRKTYHSATFDLAQLEKNPYYAVSSVSFDRETLDTLNRQDVDAFVDSDVRNDIMHDLILNQHHYVDIFPYSLDLDELIEDMQNFVAILQQEHKIKTIHKTIRFTIDRR